MPSVGRGSRARSRRQPSSDGIETGASSQRSRAEAVDEDDEEQQNAASDDDDEEAHPTRGSSKKVSKKQNGSKAKSKSSRTIAREDDGDRAIEDAPIDVENFENQPLSKADGMKVGGMASDWQSFAQKAKSTALSLVTEVAGAMAEAGMGNDGEPALKELLQIDIVMRELLDTQAELRAHQDALDEIRQSVARGDPVNDVLDRYNEGVMMRVDGWKQKTSRQKYGKDDDYVRFKSTIFEIQHPDTAMPPLVEMIDKEDRDDSDDDDVVVGGVTQNYTCPLSLTVMVNPLTSEVCQHSFSENAIKEYLGSNRSVKKKCPAAGCSKLFGLSDLKPDKELERRVKAYDRRARRREAEADSDMEDAGEVID